MRDQIAFLLLRTVQIASSEVHRPHRTVIVPLVAEHLTNTEIGDRLFMSPKTVKTHLAHIFAKLGVKSRAELATQAIRRAAPDR